MAEATTPTPAPTTGAEKTVQVKGKVVGDPADAKEREARERKIDEQAQKAAREQQEKEQEFFDGAIESITKYFSEHTVSNRRRDDFITRLSRELRKIQTVAAASKVRGPGVVEKPAEGGAPGVQVLPATRVFAGEKPKSGEGMSTANPVKAPGTANPTKVEGAK